MSSACQCQFPLIHACSADMLHPPRHGINKNKLLIIYYLFMLRHRQYFQFINKWQRTPKIMCAQRLEKMRQKFRCTFLVKTTCFSFLLTKLHGIRCCWCWLFAFEQFIAIVVACVVAYFGNSRRHKCDRQCNLCRFNAIFVHLRIQWTACMYVCVHVCVWACHCDAVLQSMFNSFIVIVIM